MGVRMWTNKLEPGAGYFVPQDLGLFPRGERDRLARSREGVTDVSRYAVVPDAQVLPDLFL
jgi:hypothetical protein